jgi:hypothetical protein
MGRCVARDCRFPAKTIDRVHVATLWQSLSDLSRKIAEEQGDGAPPHWNGAFVGVCTLPRAPCDGPVLYGVWG